MGGLLWVGCCGGCRGGVVGVVGVGRVVCGGEGLGGGCGWVVVKTFHGAYILLLRTSIHTFN